MKQKAKIQEMEANESVNPAYHKIPPAGQLLEADGEQVQELDETVTLRATSKVTFMRLTPLVGG